VGRVVPVPVKKLANPFPSAQKANWRSPKATLRCNREWLGRFLDDHCGLEAGAFTTGAFAAWKLELRARRYAAGTINHLLKAVRAMFAFAEQTGVLQNGPPLGRVQSERCAWLTAATRFWHTRLALLWPSHSGSQPPHPASRSWTGCQVPPNGSRGREMSVDIAFGMFPPSIGRTRRPLRENGRPPSMPGWLRRCRKYRDT